MEGDISRFYRETGEARPGAAILALSVLPLQGRDGKEFGRILKTRVDSIFCGAQARERGIGPRLENSFV